jgi:hypothetical protein
MENAAKGGISTREKSGEGELEVLDSPRKDQYIQDRGTVCGNEIEPVP